jgi:hypothetical protein
MAISILECIDSEKEPGQATDAKHKFAKKRFIACNQWKLTPETKPQLR